MADIQLGCQTLLHASLSNNTWSVYTNALKTFNTFRQQYGLMNMWPAPESQIACFISYCFNQGFLPATVSTYLSAVSYIHKIKHYSDPTQSFLIKKILDGLKRLRSRSDIRAPITYDILVQICQVLPFVCFNTYEIALFRAIFSLAYFGLLRVGELVYTDKHQAGYSLCFDDVRFVANQMTVRIKMSKTNRSGIPEFLHIPSVHDKKVCPVLAMKQYIQLRSSFSGPLFCHANGLPATRYQFGAVLSKSLSYLGLPLRCYKSHSFRIGRSTTLAMAGVPSEQIKRMGRWKSNAYTTYIRCN